jgi:hypothetical protein
MPSDVKNKVNRLVFRSMLLFISKLSFGYINYFIENCRWPVPKPRWCHPEDIESDDDDKLASDHTARIQYNYVLGRKYKLRVRSISISVPIMEAKSTDG